jgi:hypothetical protein
MIMSQLRRRQSVLWTGVTAVAALAACDNAGESLSTRVPGGGSIGVVAYFDRDGSGTPNPPVDTAFAGVQVMLISPGGGAPIDSGQTDVGGAVTFSNLPTGRYTVRVDTVGLGDSLVFTGTSPTEVTVLLNAAPPTILASFGFATSSIAAARGLAVGTRTLIRGVILAGLGTYSDTTAYIGDSTGSIRLTTAAGAFSVPGDSVRVVGTVARRTGQPVLDNAQISAYYLIPPGGVEPAPVSVSSGTAAGASNGQLDAALVSITAATIIDTLTSGTDFVIQVNDGSGQLEIAVDAVISLPAAPIVLGGTLDAIGVLAPAPGATWQLKPRSTADLTIH